MKSFVITFLAGGLVLAAGAYAGEHGETPKHEAPQEVNNCVGSGPQAPRDIDVKTGTNTTIFSLAPPLEDLNLCNVHFHRNAEHKAAAYSTFVSDGEHSGWACQEPKAGRSKEHHASYKGCEGVSDGDTIEVHWVYTTCDINAEGAQPVGAGLKACLTTTCGNPEFRVTAQVFVLEKESKLEFTDSIPVKHDDETVVYIGSTTGTSFSNDHCSPFQVTWDVKTTCDSLNIDSFSKWCSDNKYNDNHAHGVRELVTSGALLSKMSN